jgi:hypothetical protein
MSEQRCRNLGSLAALQIRIEPLGNRDRMAVESTLAEVAPDWSVELQGICTEEATLIVLPEGGDDAYGPSFAISRDAFGLRLDQLHWDELTEIGVYASMNDLLDAMCVQLAGWCDVPMLAKITIH